MQREVTFTSLFTYFFLLELRLEWGQLAGQRSDMAAAHKRCERLQFSSVYFNKPTQWPLH